MGAPMARHLAKAVQLSVFDVDPNKAPSIEGAVAANEAQSAARDADIVLLSLPTSEIVRSVVLGEEGILNTMKSGSCLIDCSTTDPQISREIAGALRNKGIDFLDAPVSGGETGAIKG